MEIKKITYKKLNFFKNISSNGGALKECIKQSNPENKIIHLHNASLGRLWGYCNEEDILKLVSKNIGLYEVIDKYPYKVYFDIDGDENCKLEEIKDIINKYFIGCQMSISGYEENNKNSYHIILNNYIINNDLERQKLKEIVKFFYSLNSNFDDKVYTINRNMKAINQSKIKKPVQKIIYDLDIKNHLITCFIKDGKNINNILINKVEETIENKFLNKLTNENYIEWSNIEKLDLSLPENFDNKNNLSLLKITPLNNNNNHSYTWRVARFCYYNNISFEDFIGWYKNKNNDEANIAKWRSHWNLLQNHPQITRVQYIDFLSNFYPQLLDYSEFKELFNYDTKNIKYINSLCQNDFIFNKKCKIFNIGMGGGKTTQTINYLKDIKDENNFIWITPNISLAQNTYTRIKENNIYCNIYDSAKNKIEKQKLIENSKNIIICLNSLFYVKKKYNVVVIDEIETFLKLFNNNSTILNLSEVWVKFIDLLKGCDKLILLDAFICKTTLNFLENLGIEYELIRRNKEDTTRKAIIKKDFNNWTNNIISDLNKNKKLIIFYPFKNERKINNEVKYPSMSNLCTTFSKFTGKNGIYHNAESSDTNNKKLKDVNKNWVEYDFVISNNKINVGLNFDVEYFDTCYLSIASFNSARDIIQFSYRARSLKSNIIKYCYLDHFNNTNCEKIEYVEKYNDLFKDLNKNVFIEKMANLKTSFLYFLNKAGYDIINEKINEDLKPLNFIEDDYYNYDKIDLYDDVVIKQLEKDIYAQIACKNKKLTVKKHYFNKLFKINTDPKILSNLWNNNKFNLITNIKNILDKDDFIKTLKNKYNWLNYYPDNIDKKFKFDIDDIDYIFNNYKFGKLNKKSKNHLILKSYINCIYGVQVIKSKKDNNKNYSFYVDDNFKDYYSSITQNIIQTNNDDFI